MSPKDIGPGATGIASEALNALVSLRDFLSTTTRTLAQPLFVESTLAVLLVAALIAWGRP